MGNLITLGIFVFIVYPDLFPHLVLAYLLLSCVCIIALGIEKLRKRKEPQEAPSTPKFQGKGFLRRLLRLITHLLLLAVILFLTTAILASIDADALCALIVYTLVVATFWGIVCVRRKQKLLRDVGDFEVPKVEELPTQTETVEDDFEAASNSEKGIPTWVRELTLIIAYIVIIFCSYHWLRSVNDFPNSGVTELGTLYIAVILYMIGFLIKHWDRVVERYKLNKEKRAERERLRQQRRMGFQYAKSVLDMTPSEYESHVGWVFSQWGFGNVKVMGGTGDFGADVLCTDDGGNKVCVQCKKYAKPVGVSAVQEVIGARGFYGCQRAMVVTTVGFTPAARQLAEKNGVELHIVN